MTRDAVPLKGRRVLLFCPATFNYDREIAAALVRMGATVNLRSDPPSDHAWLKALARLAPRLAWIHADELYRRWLSTLGRIAFDEVLIIKGEFLSPAVLHTLRRRFPTAKFTLYLWDNVRNAPHIERKFAFFDRILSFDRQDCRAFPALRYRPLFFLDRYWKGEAGTGEGVFFVGTLNGDRPRVLRGLIPSFQQAQVALDYWLYVRSRLELRLRRMVDPALRGLDGSRLIYSAMASGEITRRFERCDAVLDIQHPRQTGLTMRTFEVLAAGKKLITTNPSVKDEDFHDPSRICVVDRSRPSLPKGFLGSTPAPLGAAFHGRYSIAGWLAEVLGLAEHSG